jgi:hypothetical protein
MPKVLIVYENIPESTDLYLLNVSEDDLKWMSKCHRHFINFEMPEDAEKACQKLSDYLEGKQKLNDNGPVDLKDCDLLIVTGFGM